jgi:prepilin-type processing-associated H-X9-DG protein
VAMDGESAYMGASSGHTRGTNLLLLDGSVKLIVPTVDMKVWKEFARIGNEAARANR